MTQSSELPDQRVPPAMTSVGRAVRSSATRADLVEAVYKRVGLSRAESARLVETVFKVITDCLERSELVKPSAFGSFVVRSKGQRMGRYHVARLLEELGCAYRLSEFGLCFDRVF